MKQQVVGVKSNDCFRFLDVELTTVSRIPETGFGTAICNRILWWSPLEVFLGLGGWLPFLTGHWPLDVGNGKWKNGFRFPLLDFWYLGYRIRRVDPSSRCCTTCGWDDCC